ncbi:MAG: alpha/beta hydrolase fold domain-containing protein [Candidatus Aminicenantes bacterium]
MKKALPNLVLITVFFCLFCCSQEKSSVISGVIQDLEATHITINDQTVTLEESGQFRYAVPLTKPEYFALDFGKEIYLYLKPGDRVTVEIDAEAPLTSIKVGGDQQEINRYLIQQTHESLKVNEYINKDIRNIIRLEEKDYVAKMNALWKPFNDRLESFIEEQKIRDDYFIKTQRSGSLYSWASILLRYPDWHRQIGGNTAYIPSERFYDFIDRLDLNDPALLDEQAYRTFLDLYFNFKTDELLENSSEFENMNYKRFRAQMKTALELFVDPTIRSEMLYSFMYPFLKDYYHKGIEDLIQTFKQNCTNLDYIKEIENFTRQDQEIRNSCTIQVYKTIDDVSLDVYIYEPSGLKKGDKRPAVAFFHGGGWECGKPEWGHTQCDHFSSLGMVAFSFEYRLSTQHDATPIESLKDTKSAIRWIRKHAEEFGVDPEKIIGSGYSAGGHLVMCTAMVDGYDESFDDLTFSPAVNTMLLWVTPAVVYPGWFTSLLRGRAELKEFNPIELIKPGLPPSIFFQGTADDTVPYKSVVEYVTKSRAAGNRCDLEVYEGQTHLNWGDNVKDVLKKMDEFLASIGYLSNIRE